MIPVTDDRDARSAAADFRIGGVAAVVEELAPAVARAGTADEYLVVWEDSRSPSGRDIWGRRVGGDGVAVGQGFRISTGAADERRPSVAWNATASQYLVVWEDGRSQATRGTDIYGRRIDPAGVPVGVDFRISSGTSAEADPVVVWNATTNQFLVVWEDGRNQATRGTDVFGRRVSTGGVPVGVDFRIGSGLADESSPAVAWNATTHQFLVVWEDSRAIATRGLDVYGRRVNTRGALMGTDFRISLGVADESSPSVAWNAGANQFLVVWQDGRNQGTRGIDVFGRRVGPGGILLGSDRLISGPNALTNEVEPAVVWNDADGQYLVLWSDGRASDTRGRDVYGRRVASGGAPSSGDFRVSGPAATGDDARPAVAWNATANQYLVVWENGRDLATRGTDVYGRRLLGLAPPQMPLADIDIVATLVADGFGLPILVASRAGDGRQYVVEKAGRVWSQQGATRTLVLDIVDLVSTGGEQGLLGLAFHPSAPERMIVSYTDTAGDTVIAEYAFPLAATAATSTPVATILQVDQPATNHNGGMIAFGPDGYLYIGLGDGGGGGDPLEHGQNPFTLLGSILRIDVDGAAPYEIPSDNPFADGVAGAPEVFAFGVRNPWRFSFDGDDLWVGDVGQNQWEEIDLITTADGGANLGWDVLEGTHCFEGTLAECVQLVFTAPIFEYAQSDGRCSVTGGRVYRGSAIPGLVGAYLFADWCTGEVTALRVDGSGAVIERHTFPNPIPRVTSFGVDNDGEMYFTVPGAVYRIEPAP